MLHSFNASYAGSSPKPRPQSSCRDNRVALRRGKETASSSSASSAALAFERNIDVLTQQVRQQWKDKEDFHDVLIKRIHLNDEKEHFICASSNAAAAPLPFFLGLPAFQPVSSQHQNDTPTAAAAAAAREPEVDLDDTASNRRQNHATSLLTSAKKSVRFDGGDIQQQDANLLSERALSIDSSDDGAMAASPVAVRRGLDGDASPPRGELSRPLGEFLGGTDNTRSQQREDASSPPQSVPLTRRRFGLPPTILEPLQQQIAEDCERTMLHIKDAYLGIRDRSMLAPVSVMRLTNESTRSVHAQTTDAHRAILKKSFSPSPSSRGGGGVVGDPPCENESIPDFHWFAEQNIVFETIAGVSDDTFGLAKCTLDSMSEDERLKLRAFAGQARRGFPVGGFTPAECHPFAIIFEPEPLSDFDTLNPQPFRIRSRLKTMLVGVIRTKRTTEQSIVGHQSNPKGRAILNVHSAGTYTARVEAQQRQRQEARTRRTASAGLNPHYVRSKPNWAAQFNNSMFLQGSVDNLMLSATNWLGMSMNNGMARDHRRPKNAPPFPDALKRLLDDVGEMGKVPLRHQKEVLSVKPYETFVCHDDMVCDVEYFVAYEEPDPILDHISCLEMDDDQPKVSSSGGGGFSASKASADGKTSRPSSATSSAAPHKKAIDLSRVLVSAKDLRKAAPTHFSTIEYTLRWGVPIDSVVERIPTDVWVRRWCPLKTTRAGSNTQEGLPLGHLLEVCRRGSMSIDVHDREGRWQYRHSFAFGATRSLAPVSSGSTSHQ